MALKSSGEIPIKFFKNTLSKLGVFLHNYSTGESFPNNFWSECGYTDEDMSDQKWLDYVHPEDLERIRRAMDAITDGETDLYNEIYRVRTKQGDYRWVSSSGDFITREEDGSPALYMGADRDITSLKKYEEELSSALDISRRHTVQTETFLAIGKALTSNLDFQNCIDAILEKTADIVPYDSASVLLLKQNYLKIAGVRGWENNNDKLGKTLDLSKNYPYNNVINSRSAGIMNDFSAYDIEDVIIHDKNIVSWLCVPLILNDKVMGLLSCNRTKTVFTEEHLQLAEGIAGFIAIALNNAEHHEKLLTQAVTDSLTGLKTRGWFYENGERLLHQAGRYEWALSVLMMDLDHFKSVNDNYGHKTGDVVLLKTAEVLKSACRRSDLLCRYGGEEFALILPETNLDDAEHIAERIRTEIEQIRVPGVSQALSISIGISIRYVSQSGSIDELLDQADKALYMAKNQGRNRWVSLGEDKNP